MRMKKFINDPKELTRQLLEGFALAHSDTVSIKSDKIVCRAEPKSSDKVALVTLGGAGHEPALSGFVGEGMLDFSVVGDIFAAPGPPKVFEALRLANRPAGILFVVLNHAGDVLSANMAAEMANKEGIRFKMLLTHEDIAPGAQAPAEDRRGLVGCIPLYKIAGAAAEAGKSLDEVHALAQRFADNMATLAVAMKTATHPASGQAIFELADDEMEIGMGQHGEAGTGPTKILTADQTAEMMLSRLLLAIQAKPGDQVMLIINGSGATTLMEMYIVLRGCKKFLDSQGIRLATARCGEFLTVQEMGGFQMFAAKMDDELLRYWNAPCNTPAMTVKGATV
jgi:dihydroxyacetone kinase-like protein